MPKITKFYRTLNFCYHRTIWGWIFQSPNSPTVFLRSLLNVMKTLAIIVGIQVSACLGNRSSFFLNVAL